ncbi:MAG: cyclodeaminase/cyclohydrolase family protein [Lachnospiraceae bacterium]|nr:cyclodeaminase/cyclohydrolase family protein [Lachnospiraceae bacterium]
MAMSEYTIDSFIKELSSDAPVPGGGGASGLVAAVGMSLGNMVMALTTGKKKYAEYQDEIESIIANANDITRALLDAMDKDAVAFEPLAKAYGLPKSTEEEIAHRNKVLEEALVVASEAPLELMEKIVEAIKVTKRVAEIGSKLAISDAGVAIQCLKAALNGASLNVFINTKMMKNRDKADEFDKRADEMIRVGNEMADEVYAKVLADVR